MIVAKYKYDKSVYENLIPVFNDGYTGYTISDEIDSVNSNHVIRTIECDTLPTKIQFGTGSTTEPVTNFTKAVIDVIYLNTSNITNMAYMFRNCHSLKNVNCSDWDTSNVTNLHSTFAGCLALTELDLSNWDTGNVINMNWMFMDSNKLSTIGDISNWDTGKVTNMACMFYNCAGLTSLDVSNFNTSKVTTMESMFRNCQKLTSLDVSNFDTSNVTNMYAMFWNCQSLTSLDVSNFDTSKVTSMGHMFQNCHSLTSLDLSNFNTSNVTNMELMFCSTDDHILSSNLIAIDGTNNWDTSNVTNMYGMFYGCINLNSIDVSNWNTSNVTNMYGMFYYCTNLTSLDVSNFNTSNVTNMYVMFHNCCSLTSLDLSNFNTSKVTNKSGMIDQCTSMKTLNLNNQEDISFALYGNLDSLNKIYINKLSKIQELSTKMPNRTGKEPGYIVTTLRDQIDEETMAALAAKNWQIKDLVAQYRFDANTYEDLMPEFNPEFTEDMYDVHDSVSEIVIDNIQWEAGSIHNASGKDVYESEDNDENRFFINYRKSDFIPAIGNVELISNYRINSIIYYDESKNYIGYSAYGYNNITNIILPNNTKYIRLTVHKDNTPDYVNLTLTAKLVTRSIESKNGDLPTQMRFGASDQNDYDSCNSLLKVLDCNTKNLNTMRRMFTRCYRLTDVNCKNWNTGNVTDMYYLFTRCNSLVSLDVSNWNTSNVTDMEATFSGGDIFDYKLVNVIGLYNWDTSNVTNMYLMFYNRTNLTSLDVSNFDTSNVTNMSFMFHGCNNLTSLDVSNFNTSNVTDMKSLFHNCKNLTSLDVSNFDTSKVDNMHCMFYGCSKLTSIDVSNFDTSKVTSMGGMFTLCNNLTSLDLSSFNTSKVTNMASMFHGCNNLTSLDVSNWDTSKVTDIHNMFYGCNKLTSLDVSNWDTSNATNMSTMFHTCRSLTSLDVSNWDTGNVTNMRAMFYVCNNLTSLDVSKWDTSKVTDMGYMFDNCNSLTSLDVSNFDTSNVTDMYSMFSDCANLSSLDITNWDTKKVVNIQYFLDGLEISSVNIKHLDISFLELSSVTHIGGMFYKNRATDIKLPKLINSNLTSVVKTYDDDQLPRGVFYCPNLVSLDFGGLDISNVTDDKSLILEHVPKLRYIRTENPALIADLAQYFPARTEAEQGYLITKANVSDEIRTLLAGKYWNVVDLDEVGTDVAIYKFDKSIYKALIPAFDNNFADWFIDDVIEDEVNAPNIVTRTIRSMGGLPTLMRFGNFDGSNAGLPVKYQSLINVLYINTESLLNHAYMFNGCIRLQSVPKMTINNKTNLNHMFCLCQLLTSLDVSNFDTSNVTRMDYMFYECRSLTSLDVSNWDTSNVINMGWMFKYCRSLTSLDVSNFDTSNVTTMSDMFHSCNSLTSLDVSNWDTSKVTSMGAMFNDCNNLTSLDVSNWNTGNVTSMAYMFYGCKALNSLDASNFNTSKVTDMTNMFYGCKLLTSLDVSKWDVSNVTIMPNMFRDCQLLTSLDVSRWDTGNVTSMMCMFVNCYNLTSLDVSRWDMRKVRRIDWMFGNCQSLTSLDVSKWEFNYMMNISGAFSMCKLINDIDVSNWDTSNVIYMTQVFVDCKLLKNIDISGWVINNPESFNSTFAGLESTSTIDLSNFKIPTTTTFDKMFNNSTGIENIGMIYCDFKTVEKVASAIPTTNHTTIWVGNHIDFNALPQYDHITYKVYEVEDKLEVELSSPLLEGDRLEIIDGDLYHYHKMVEMLIDNSWVWHYGSTESGWNQSTDYIAAYTYGNGFGDQYISNLKGFGKIICSKYSTVQCYVDGTNLRNTIAAHVINREAIQCRNGNSTSTYIGIRIHKNRLSEISKEGINEYLHNNPFTIIHELANPYYELVKPNVGLLNVEQGLYLNISDSVVPVVNHQDLCTLKLNYLLPNVEYKVKFKANNPGSIAINLGGTLVPLDVVEGWNEVMVTTPETLVDEYLKVNGSEGIKIQNVMVIDSDKDFDYFKGMNNTFDEIPVKNICKNRTLTYTHGVDEEGVSPQGEMNVNVSKGKVVTVVGKVSNNPDNLPISINLYNNTGRATGKNLWVYGDSIVGGVVIYQDQYNPILKAGTYTISSDTTKLYEHSPVITFCSTTGNNGNCIAYDYLTEGRSKTLELTQDVYRIVLYSNEFRYPESINNPIEFKNIQIEEGEVATAYEPPEFNVNDNPIFINPDENGYFAITIRADRDYANRIGFNVGEASSCEANDQVTITDLMVFEGDILDCHPTTYVNPADTRYLVEYKSIGNPFGFGKNKLI